MPYRGSIKDKEAHRRYYVAHRDHLRACIRANKLKRDHGITVTEKERLIQQQEGRCQICRVPESPGNRLQVDHDHLLEHRRGLLCGKCNKALGLFGDNIFMLKAAIRYLQTANFWVGKENLPPKLKAMIASQQEQVQ